MKILIVDDEKTWLRTLSKILENLGGHELFLAQNLAEALQILETQLIDLALVDLQLSPDMRNRDGLKLIEEIRANHQAVPIVVSGNVQQADLREALRCGARDYIYKSEIDEEMIANLLREQDRQFQMEQELLELRARSLPGAPTLGLIGNSPSMERLRARIRQVACAPITDAVLITGPTGSGKELVAQAIHALGKNAREPCFALNCGAIQKDLLEAELFGCTPNAYTGAKDRLGALKSAGKGTLFLDEVAELQMELQVKLLRAVEARCFRRLGSDEESKFEARIITATHADLKERIAKGAFREDLWYRLSHLVIRVPSLDERKEDIPALLEHFILMDERKTNGQKLTFTPEAMELLCQRHWRGNVRELRYSLATLALRGPLITREILSEEGYGPDIPGHPSPRPDVGAWSRIARMILDLPAMAPDGARLSRLEMIEDALMEEALERAGNQAGAAKLIGEHRKVVGRWQGKKGKTVTEPDDED